MNRLPRVSRVLVGMDFDDASAAALKAAAVLASAWDAEITVFHSAPQEVPAYFTAAQLASLQAEHEQSRARTATQVRAFATQHLARAFGVVVEEGPPADAIVRTAAAFDLIVIGTHRRHGARRWWLGSVAEGVVARSPRPVLVVAAGAMLPETRRNLTILAAGNRVAEAEAWVDVLIATFGGQVVRASNLGQCAPDRLHNTDLIVVSMPTDGAAERQLAGIVQVLKECVHPVLFVPSAGGAVERSPS